MQRLNTIETNIELNSQHIDHKRCQAKTARIKWRRQNAQDQIAQDKNLNLLQQHSHWFVDVNFAVALQILLQVFTVH